MPGRVRRVRLLAMAICLVTIFFLYERNAARVDQYASVITHTVGGYGGAVLRPQPPPPPQANHVQDEQKKQQQVKEQEAAAAQKEIAKEQPPIANPIPKPLGIPAPAPTTTSTSTTPGVQAAKPTPNEAVGSGSQAVDGKKKKPKDGLSQHELELMLKYSAGELPANGRDALGSVYKDKPNDGKNYEEEDEEDDVTAISDAIGGTAAGVSNAGLDEGGKGRVEEDLKDKSPTVHWERPRAHFPISTTVALPSGSAVPIPRIQHAGKGAADLTRRKAVEDAMAHAWSGYRKYGWGYDEVKPVSKEPRNTFNGWGATLVDSLDTLWIMNMTTAFEEAVAKVATVDFTTSRRNDIPLFEVTIRYMGGLIGAYDVSGRKHKVLLEKALELGEILYGAFDTPNRMPITYYYWKPAFSSQPHRAPSNVVMAELGSLTLEMTRLAQLSGEPKFYDAVARITDAFERWQPHTRVPGLFPTRLDASGCDKPAQRPKAGEFKDLSIKPSKQDEIVLNREAQPPIAKRDLTTEAADGLEKRAAGHGLGLDSEGKPRAEKMVAPVGPKTDRKVFAAESKKIAVDKDDLSLDENIIDDSDELCRPQGLGSVSKESSETFTLGGASDSTFEYLPKEYLLLGGQGAEQYKSMYLTAAQTSIDRLLFRPMTPQNYDILISGQVDVDWDATTGQYNEFFDPKGEHLTCFVGGMFALGSRLFEKPDHLDIARKLTEGCIWAYNATASGIMPEIFRAAKCDSRTKCTWDEKKYHEMLASRSDIMDAEAARQFIKMQMAIEADTPLAQPDVDSALNKLEAEDESADAPIVHKDTAKTPEIKDGATKANSPSKDKAAAAVEKPNQKVPTNPGLEGASLPLDTSGNVKPALPAGQKGAITPSRPGEAALPAGKGLDAPGLHKRQVIDDVDVPADAPVVAQPIPVPMGMEKHATTSTSSTSTGPFIAGAPPATKTPATATTTETAATITAKSDDELSLDEIVKYIVGSEHLPVGMTRLISTAYILRPEAIESVFYMYRITGEQYWRDVGWKMFQAIQAATKTEIANTAIHDVTVKNPPHGDIMESFYLGETLKYFYLLFDDPDTWSLDDWVLNTEAHFFQRRKPKQDSAAGVPAPIATPAVAVAGAPAGAVAGSPAAPKNP